ncbi:hypothetical protein V5O48_011774 [Marasmius crinis-equi]|uniref:Uncharacterized protein n=1 Tax=Marasmius crinis-equi TaxID=585013 RepID=A0ABR3F4N5_9AGAR
MSDYFRNARDFTLNRPNFNNVGRDQYIYHNHTTITTAQPKSRLWVQGTEEEEGEFEQYHEVKRADVKLSHPICSYRVTRRGHEIEKKFFKGEIMRGNGQSTGLMVVGYEGQDAREDQLGCLWEEVWMDLKDGALCREPEGPYPEVEWEGFGIKIENIPSSAELLKEDVFFRFLTGLKLKAADPVVLKALHLASRQEFVDLQFNQPTVIYSLTNTPIASVTPSWYQYGGTDGVLLADGQTRFTLINPPTNIKIQLSSSPTAWLLQAWNMFYALGVSLEEDLSQYKLILPAIYLNLCLSSSKHKSRRRGDRPIFPFVRPLPSTLLQSCTTPSLHYWSFDEDGRSPLARAMCHHLGLPVALGLEFGNANAHSWSNDVYKRMHAYQVARGFDPSTTDFAWSHEDAYPAYKPIQNNSGRFEEVDSEAIEERNSVDPQPSSPPEPYRSQTPNESDVDTDCDYSDTDGGTHSDTDTGDGDGDADTDVSEPEVNDLYVRLGNLVLG